MKPIKERIGKWKEQTLLHKAGDIFFWVLIILLLIPASRKYIATGVNQIVLHIRKPAADPENKQLKLSETDYVLRFSDSANNLYSLEDFKGEVVFLNLWATWCPPCIAEMPGIEKLHADYGDRVRFILLTNQQAGEVEPFISARDLKAPVYFQLSQLPGVLETSSIPTTFIISRDGRIVARHTGAMDWNAGSTRKMLDDLLAQDVLR